jgi:Icc-related predicted phosphoesterase
MRIKIVSDLHLEFADINITNNEACDVLILSGDIMVAEDLHSHPETKYSHLELRQLVHGQARAQLFRDFLKRCSFQFPHVIYLAGNHEFYHGRWEGSIQHLRDECSKFPNVYFLERDLKEIDDVTFVGGTLWTDCNRGDPVTLHSLTNMINDFRLIRDDTKGYSKLKPATTVHRHRETLEFIRKTVDSDSSKKYVVVGHHSPSFQSCHEQYKNDRIMNGGYHSELGNFIADRPQIKLWTHGHTHHCFDYVIGETRVVCNPRGYSGYEQTGWNPNICIEV